VTGRRLVVVLAAAACLAYPIAVLAGGPPRFPSREDCVREAVDGAEIEAVFGRFATEQEAAELQGRALAVGFPGTEVIRDACGLAKVSLPGIPTLEVGREFVEQARSAGFEVTLERAG